MSSSVRCFEYGRRLVCWVALLPVVSHQAQAGFTVTDLGVMSQGQSSGATGINASGATSGTMFASGSSLAVQAAGDGTFRAISMSGLPGVTSSSAAAINDSAQVTGSFYDSIDRTTHAFYATSGAATDLGKFTDPRFQGANSYGVAISSSGQVLGNAQLTDGSRVAFRASSAGAISTIILPGGSQVGSAGGINSQGTVVGSFVNNLGISHVFMADGNTATQVVSTMPVQGFGLNSYGVAINDSKTIIGYGDYNGGSHAFYLPHQGSLVDIGVTGGFSSSMALGLNNQGQVVGTLSSSGGSGHAFFWDQSAGLFDLNTLLSASDSASWVLTSATGINDRDQIAGQGYINGQLHGFLLTPVPGSEGFFPSATVPAPPSACLAAIGLGVAGGWYRLRHGRTRGQGTA